MGKVKIFFDKNRVAILLPLLLLLFLGNLLRTYSYATVPHPGETTDEYVFAWSGLSLMTQGIPIGWSYVKNAYKNTWDEKINVDNIYDKEPARPPFTMVKPWFDKPPAFSLLIGGYSYLKGAKEFYQTSVGIIRRPMLRIAILTTLLIFWLGTRLFGKWVGLMAALLYSFIPTTVISSRLVMAENAYIPIFLGAIISASYYFEKRKKVFLIFASILAALAILFKVSGISILLALFILVISFSKGKERRKDVFLVSLIGISGLVIFFIYGALIDWQVFINVFRSQSNLFYGAGAEIFYSALNNSKITAQSFFTDGWITALWVSFCILIFSKFKDDLGTKFISISLFSYLLIFLFFGSESYGWYRFPFFPFLLISLAKVIVELLKKPNLLLFLILALLPFGTAAHRVLGLEGFQPFVPAFRAYAILSVLIFGLAIIYKTKLIFWLQRIYIVATLFFLIYLSIAEILFYTYDKWFFVT